MADPYALLSSNGYGFGYVGYGYGYTRWYHYGYGYGAGMITYHQSSDMYMEIDMAYRRRLSDAGSSVEDVRAQMNSALQLPPGLKTSMVVKTAATRRLAQNGTELPRRSRRRLNTDVGVISFRIATQGDSAVSTDAVAEEMKQQVTKGKGGMNAALSSLGSVNTKAGLAVATTEVEIDTGANRSNRSGQGRRNRNATTSTTTINADASPFSLISEALEGAAAAAAAMLRGEGSATLETPVGQVTFLELIPPSDDRAVMQVENLSQRSSPVTVSLPSALVTKLCQAGRVVLQVYEFSDSLQSQDEAGHSVVAQSGMVDVSILQEMPTADNATNVTVDNSTVSLTTVTITDVEDEVLIRLSDAQPQSADRCAFFDEGSKKWAYAGTALDRSPARSGTWCRASHLTLFVVIRAVDSDESSSQQSHLKVLVVGVVIGAISLGLLGGLCAVVVGYCSGSPKKHSKLKDDVEADAVHATSQDAPPNNDDNSSILDNNNAAEVDNSSVLDNNVAEAKTEINPQGNDSIIIEVDHPDADADPMEAAEL
ncbi:unnamed protein product [Symbiodinium sp. CCMP2592]|nr:unnamed protein product [Symbiodinium sp. CCMP2592]